METHNFMPVPSSPTSVIVKYPVMLREAPNAAGHQCKKLSIKFEKVNNDVRLQP